jgi:type IV pilus assembly protein PilO
MTKFDEMSVVTKIGILLVVAGIVGGGFYFWPLGPVYDEIKQVNAQVADKKAENARLKDFEPKLAQVNKTIAQLETQLLEAKKIVPDDKEADEFIKLLHDTAAVSGIEIRRYTAMPIASHQFYTEVPFMLDLDGPYFSLLNFFDRVGKLERIINIGNLQMSNTKNTSPSKVRSTYSYAPSETVVASCTATTFFSHDLAPPPDKSATVKQ